MQSRAPSPSCNKEGIISSLVNTEEKKDIPKTPLDLKMELIEKFRFFKDCKVKWDIKKKEEIANLLTIKRVKAGERVFKPEQDKLDCFYIILAGKTGIFGPSQRIIN
jgi:hypothetical protein